MPNNCDDLTTMAPTTISINRGGGDTWLLSINTDTVNIVRLGKADG